MTTLINQIGPRVTAAVAAEAPGVAVVEAAPDATRSSSSSSPSHAPGGRSLTQTLGRRFSNAMIVASTNSAIGTA